MISPDEFLKKHGYGEDGNKDKAEKDEPDHSLERHARDRAEHLTRPNAGTPHDWEDWEKHRQQADKEDGSSRDLNRERN